MRYASLLVACGLLVLWMSVSDCRVAMEERESVNAHANLWSIVIASEEHLNEMEELLRNEFEAEILSGSDSAAYGHLPKEWIVCDVPARMNLVIRDRLNNHRHVVHSQMEIRRQRTKKGSLRSGGQNGSEIPTQMTYKDKNIDINSPFRLSDHLRTLESVSLQLNVRDQPTHTHTLTVTPRDAGQSLFDDPLYRDQWHILNTGQSGGSESIDANVVGAWERGFTGRGVQIAIVDDGVQRLHPDLVDNFVLESSFSFNDHSHDPTPIPTESHGTSCAGVAAAAANNGECGVGVAYGAALAGIEILGASSVDVDEASALTYDMQHNMIYSNSWGPVDTGAVLEGPGPRTRAAIAQGVEEGRGGKGAIYVWAAGNGLENNDNVNYDGFANLIETIAVGAIDHYGRQSYYSEPGAPMLITAPSSGIDMGITTIDLTGSAGSDPGDCTGDFGGTSSATPVVSGVVALMLESNSELGWRDVQHILVHTARLVDVSDADWSYNGAGFHVNHKYGFGLVDASAAVELSSHWTPFPRHALMTELTSSHSSDIPDGTGDAVQWHFDVGDDVGPLEHVQVEVTVNHRRASDLEITIESPDGTISVLAEDHGYDLVAQLTTSVETDSGVWASYSTQCPEEGISGPVLAANPANGCSTLHGDYHGAIVLISRGDCDFIQKSYYAQDSGAAAVLVYDNASEPPFAMGGNDPHVTIPSAMISQADGRQLLTSIESYEGEDGIVGTLRNVTDKPLSDPYNGWTFMSVRHWGESGVGRWIVRVEDKYASVHGSLESITLRLFGSGLDDSDTMSSQLVDNSVITSSSELLSSSSGGIESSTSNEHGSSREYWEYLFIVSTSLLVTSFCVLVIALTIVSIGFVVYRYRKRQEVTYDIAYELKEVEESDSTVLLDDDEVGLNPLHEDL